MCRFAILALIGCAGALLAGCKTGATASFMGEGPSTATTPPSSQPTLSIHPSDPRRPTLVNFKHDPHSEAPPPLTIFGSKEVGVYIPAPDMAQSGDELPWLSISDGWIYITGEAPRVSINTVAAGAEGSTMVAYKVANATDPRVRFVLIETQGKKPGDVEQPGASPPKRSFANHSPSYIDVHTSGSGTIDPPVTFTMPDFSQPKPAAFDQELWDYLTVVDTALHGFGLNWPTGTVGP
jgi:hypothetical protein